MAEQLRFFIVLEKDESCWLDNCLRAGCFARFLQGLDESKLA
jgi:hypothetical protein